ncbi:uncharacterized protein SCHCODRAFT_02626710 [Schizophyllum commune H4-8]|uniref:THIF-type NAD/FAD binding fold domain-containing protein n=1 Tax=Schizophyllum commune (strain H4-8 / FGSC 9210) TaxID=578458 RepID=D8Q4E9_SCHCM|nr:uncharacterized protein SCHCODRAFT_02626710 [Schizophyllum commune H4-8]KAI5892643.1 hypothetical protein SCHCODRAFT_02626710 [Schizophyllum commune H4-8]
MSAWRAYSRRVRRRSLDADILRSISRGESETGSKSPSLHAYSPPSHSQGYDEDLIREQLARNYAFFGEEGMAKVRGASVAVIGCGGVGSWAAVMLVRSGVSKIRLVDFDYVTLSSLNRHACAGLNDVGTPKVVCIERNLKNISRWVDVDARIELWRKDNGGDLLEGVDWVVDCIDNITTKVDLLKYCHDKGIKVFSSMGAGAKSDPTRIQISDISSTVYDPLARAVRRRLRLEGVTSGIPVVYSTEPPSEVKLLPLPEEEFQKGAVKELGVFDDFRVRILPVIGPLPSIFGLHAATYILCDVAGQPIPNPLPIKNRRKLYDRLLRDLLNRERKVTGVDINRLPIDEEDVSFILEDLHRGRSIVPPHDVPSKPTLVRWDPDRPLSLENCVVMEQSDADKHTKQCLSSEKTHTPEDLWGAEAKRVFESRRMEIKRYREAMAF